jgi:hypothetical protein
MPRYFLYALLVLVVAAGLYVVISQTDKPTADFLNQPVVTNKPSAPEVKKDFVSPISDALSRITKKTFGLKISTLNSPVSPERFAGYHTGVDFETLGNEQNIDVPVYAVCTGQLVLKKWASGYGGVAVQSCKLADDDITVVYGHVKLASVTAKLNQPLTAGQQLGVLGQGYSTETDNERKHLHLGIHQGTAIDIRGYVAKENQLKNWLDIKPYLKD